MDKNVISPNEITEIKETPDQPARIESKLPPAIPWWARISVGLLVLCLPLLCLITIILRVAFRGETPRIRYAWTAYLTTLLIISGFLTSGIAVVAFSLGPLPSIAGMAAGTAEVDARAECPALPMAKDLSAADESSELKRVVGVIAPTAASWFSKREVLSNSFGAGMLLEATDQGYLFATARHVISTGVW